MEKNVRYQLAKVMANELIYREKSITTCNEQAMERIKVREMSRHGSF